MAGICSLHHRHQVPVDASRAAEVTVPDVTRICTEGLAAWMAAIRESNDRLSPTLTP